MEPAGAARHRRAARQAEASESESITRRVLVLAGCRFEWRRLCTLAFSEGGRDITGTIPRRPCRVERSETSLFSNLWELSRKRAEILRFAQNDIC
jgi:hypothetical protein